MFHFGRLDSHCAVNFSAVYVPDVTTANPPGLPDGLFTNQKSKFGQILDGLRMENAGIFYGHLVYFTAIWYILWPCGNVMVIWYIFFRFSAFPLSCAKKNLATL
jgi:hypothetical protein